MINLVAEMCEFLNEPVESVVHHAKATSKPLAKAWEEKRGSSMDFYRHNKEYLYDILGFNSCEGYRKYLTPLANIRGLKVLDIGCGIGTLCYLLNHLGNEVTGYDINEYCIDFCQTVSKKHNKGITFTAVMPDVSQFDLITAIDTLEHIEDMAGFLKDVGSKMKPMARFYNHSCWYEDKDYPMHYAHKDKAKQWFEDAGFRVLSEYWAVKL